MAVDSCLMSIQLRYAPFPSITYRECTGFGMLSPFEVMMNLGTTHHLHTIRTITIPFALAVEPAVEPMSFESLQHHPPEAQAQLQAERLNSASCKLPAGVGKERGMPVDCMYGCSKGAQDSQYAMHRIHRVQLQRYLMSHDDLYRCQHSAVTESHESCRARP